MILLLAAFALNPAVTQETIATTICVRGYTGTIRPPRAVMYSIKRKMMRTQHITARRIADHIVPLELGGAASDPANIQLQTRTAAARKDRLENSTRRAVCAGRMTLAEGQAVFEVKP